MSASMIRVLQCVSVQGARTICRVLLVLVVLWCELGVFSWILADCRWPDAQLSTHQVGLIGLPQSNT